MGRLWIAAALCLMVFVHHHAYVNGSEVEDLSAHDKREEGRLEDVQPHGKGKASARHAAAVHAHAKATRKVKELSKKAGVKYRAPVKPEVRDAAYAKYAQRERYEKRKGMFPPVKTKEQAVKRTYEIMHKNSRRAKRNAAKEKRRKYSALLGESGDSEVKPLREEAKRYRPFVDHPEYNPRFDPDNVRREVSSRADKFVKKTWFGPKDSLEKMQNPQLPSRNRGPSELAIKTSKKKMMASIKAEEKEERKKESIISTRLNQAIKDHGVKHTKKATGLTHADKVLLRQQVHQVMQQVNHVAKTVSAKVMELDNNGPPAAGSHKQITITANKIASAVTNKLKNVKKEAHKIVARAHAKAHRILNQAQNKARKKIHVARASAIAWHKDMARLRKIPKDKTSRNSRSSSAHKKKSNVLSNVSPRKTHNTYT